MDFRVMQRSNVRRVQIDLFYDCLNNVTLYPKWQSFLRYQQPQSLILRGQNDIFFTKEGGEAYMKDVPNDEIHRLDSGYFAIEDCFDEIADSIQHFYLREWLMSQLDKNSETIGKSMLGKCFISYHHRHYYHTSGIGREASYLHDLQSPFSFSYTLENTLDAYASNHYGLLVSIS
jgi:hypothetical protein